MLPIQVNNLKLEPVTTAACLAVLAQLEEDCFPWDCWTLGQLEAFLQASIRRAYLLVTETEPVGYVLVTVFDGEAEIERLGVASVHRGRHYGSRLIEALRQQLGLERMVLEVSVKNHAALALYQSCGFCALSRRQNYYHDGADALMMEWKREE